MSKRRRGASRPVDVAMRADRPEKKAVRRLWVDKVVNYGTKFPGEDDLLYLSLCGSEGHDIALLVERGVIQLNEIGSISPQSAHRVAAIEVNLEAVSALLHKFPGLKVYDRPFQNLVRGASRLTYPSGDDAEFCRARIINLDLNASLRSIEDDDVVFPILIWVQKLGEMHLQRPRRDWCLCLTLHGEFHWNRSTCRFVQEFLADNFTTAPQFAAAAEAILGSELYQNINDAGFFDFSSLQREQQQKILMVFVPKKLTEMLQSQGWKITTQANLRYGRQHHAPMVSWIIDFEHDRQVSARPRASYIRSLNSVLSGAGLINGKGNLISDNE